MTIIDAETTTPVHCANTPGDDWLKHEGGSNAYRGGKDYFDAAVFAAKALAAQLGPGWVGYVHYNMGWHYEAHDAQNRVSVQDEDGNCAVGDGGRKRERHYRAYLRTPNYACDFSGEGQSPQVAVRKAVAKVKARVAELQAMVAGL